VVSTTEYFIPLEGKLDIEAEISRVEGELAYYRGFLAIVMKKLDNERFVNNAPPEVLELERKKKSDAESRIILLEDRLRELKEM
jgi:valyl-tRNA synthetase